MASENIPSSSGLWEREGKFYRVWQTDYSEGRSYRLFADVFDADWSIGKSIEVDSGLLPKGNWRKVTPAPPTPPPAVIEGRGQVVGNDAEIYGAQPLPDCAVGDTVSAVAPSSLHCGSGFYAYAIVVDVDANKKPVALVSPSGDMLWTATLDRLRLVVTGKAHWRELFVALRRYEGEKFPPPPAFVAPPKPKQLVRIKDEPGTEFWASKATDGNWIAGTSRYGYGMIEIIDDKTGKPINEAGAPVGE